MLESHSGASPIRTSAKVHRDLKPANVKITPEGVVKVLDFGLAETFEADTTTSETGNSPTATVPLTEAGVSLGTAAYRSPEQARGELVDKRADIWAFGCVLYEMLSGKAAFQGKSTSEDSGGHAEGRTRLEPDSRKDAAPFAALLDKNAKHRLRDTNAMLLPDSSCVFEHVRPAANPSGELPCKPRPGKFPVPLQRGN